MSIPSGPIKSFHISHNKPELPAPSESGRNGSNLFEKAKKIIIWFFGGQASDEETLVELRSNVEKDRLIQRRYESNLRELKKYTKKDLVARAEIAVDRLEKTKDSIIKDFGDAGMGFIFRHIDPILTSSRKILSSLGEVEKKIHQQDNEEVIKEQEGMIADVLFDAVAAVELYSIVHDEEYLKRRVVDSVHQHAVQAVQKDIQILWTYFESCFKECTPIESTIEDDLVPVLAKLEALPLSFPATLDLADVFAWRRKFDVIRNGLVALATHVIDVCTVRRHAPDLDGEAGPSMVLENDVQSNIEFLTSCIDLELALLRLKQGVGQPDIEAYGGLCALFCNVIESFGGSLGGRSEEILQNLESIRSEAERLVSGR